MLTKTSDITVTKGTDIVQFHGPVTGAKIVVCEWHDSKVGEVKTYAIDEVWVPEFSRGKGIGHALMTRVLQHYDAQNMPMRLVVAGCCMPTPGESERALDEMHSGSGHRHTCDQQSERLSHHGLLRWYKSYGFVDRPDCDSWSGECGCSYALYRPVPRV